ncbi:MAG: FAD/NAD(P)-binding protein [Anaerolineales bacterium]|jgi:NAD(P)H-flavin reductase
MSTNGQNALKPHLAKLVGVKDMAPEIKLFRLEMLNGGGEAFLDYQPGQFAFVSAFGVGEAPFGIASTPERGTIIEFAVQRLGGVTTELHELGEGDIVGVRGPLGNCFPMDSFKGKDILVLGGGIGGAPLRPVLQTIFDHREDYGNLTILWAARNPDLLIFKDEYQNWRNAPNTKLHLTVDEADTTWDGDIGLITSLLEKVAPSSKNTIAITCGPPIMIFYVDKTLKMLGFAPQQSFVTLEARMHCGIGKCGRCNLGEKLVCVDGPVFSMAEVGELLESFL